MRRMWKKSEPGAATTPPATAARRKNNINIGGSDKKDATKMEGNG